MADRDETIQKRNTSRLWFRQPIDAEPAARPAQTPSAEITLIVQRAPASRDGYAYFEGADEFNLDTTGLKMRALNFDDPRVRSLVHGNAPTAIASIDRSAWSTFPSTAPDILLSATEQLGVHILGRVLGPGVRYRVVDAHNGVIAVDIDRLGLPPLRGYCTSVEFSAATQGARPKRASSQTDWIRSVSAKVSQALGTVDMTLNNTASPAPD